MLLAIPVAPSARAVLEVEAETSVKTDSGLPYQLNTFSHAADSPWLFFDDVANGFVLSHHLGSA